MSENTPPEIPSVNRCISYLRDFGPGTTDTTDRYMMRWAADNLAVLDSRAKHWQRVAEAAQAQIGALKGPLDLYEIELLDIEDALEPLIEGGDGQAAVTLPLGHWRCLYAYIRQVLPASEAASEETKQKIELGAAE